jgi:hypothetical protein
MAQTCGLEDEGGADPECVHAREAARDVHPKHAEADKELHDEGEDEEHVVERLERSTDIAHRACEEAAFFVYLHERCLDLGAREIAIVVLVKNAEGRVRSLGGGKRGVEVRRDQVVPRRGLVTHVDGTRKPLRPN